MFTSSVAPVYCSSLYSFTLVSCVVGKELLYRTREGDVLKFNMETNESTVLVPNRKFVSLSFYMC